MLATILPSVMLATQTTNVTTINICVVLGVNSIQHGYGRMQTSDQEQWATQQAEADIGSMLIATRSPYRLELRRLYAGSNADSDAAAAAIADFAQTCSQAGAGAFVGGYMSDRSLLKLQPMLATLGLAVLMPASGLPDLPAPRSNILRFWPSDEHQAKALHQRLANVTGVAAPDIVILSRDDVTGRGLTNAFTQSLHTQRQLVLPVQWYNGTAADAATKLPAIAKAIRASTAARVGFLCNCGPEEIAEILDAMRAARWPASKTAMALSDRSTPTRAVVASPPRAAFALEVRLSGTLSAIASSENPVFTSLQRRWVDEGHATSMFASSSSLYDVIHLAAAASMAVGGGNTTAPVAGPGGSAGRNRPAFTQAVWAAGLRGWGATGSMALDDSGDLHRSRYDVYALINASGGAEAAWAVVDHIDLTGGNNSNLDNSTLTQRGDTSDATRGSLDASARRALERQSLVELAMSTQLSGWARKTNWLDARHSVCDWDLVGCDADGFVKLLTLDFNNLTGTLPTSLGALQSLQDLDLEYNNLFGTLPPSLGGLSSLVQLGLGGNAFSGLLPAEICPVLGRIQSSRGPKKPCDLSGSLYRCPLPCPELAVGMCRANCSAA